jgi:hypothetical protein
MKQLEPERYMGGDWRPDLIPYDTEHLRDTGKFFIEAALQLESPTSVAYDRTSLEEQGGDLGTFEGAISGLRVMTFEQEPDQTANRYTRGWLEKLDHAYRASLPFDLAEQRWLLETHTHALDVHDEATTQARAAQTLMQRLLERFRAPQPLATIEASSIEHVIRQSGTVISAGLPREVSGQELLARWSRWRAGEDPYAGGVARTLARMRDIAAFCLQEVSSP